MLGAVLCGLCQGAWLSIALTFIADQDDPADVPGVSALAQGGGYLLAACGPLALGMLYQLTAGWIAPAGFLVSTLVAVLVLALWLSRSARRRRTASALPNRSLE